MTPIILRYAEDRTGENPNNRVVNETHQTVNRRVRAIAPYHGPFYSESVVVRNAVTNDVLIKDVDYHAVEYYESISRLTGKEVCAIILIVNEGITHQEFSIDYQVVGGEFSYGYDSIAKMMDKINNDDRPVHWGNLLNLPPEFIPSAHLHDIGDTFGWEYVIAELELIRKAILMGDSASHDEIYMYIDRRVDELRGESDQLELRVDAHLANENNPHNVTKDQVGLGLVENYRPSTKSEAEAGSLNNVYMTALRVKEAITFQAVTPLTNLLNAHTSRTDNPHSVTKAQTGLGSVENFGVASKAQAEAGSANNLYMTPLRVKEAITAQAGTRLDAHLADANNPHNVTKAQVGLGSVENYGIATQAEAEAGTSNAKYMTPLRTSQAITTLAIGPLNTHIYNKGNPHNVTKAQVGLGSVENYGIATQAEAQAGWSNAKYMTPLRAKQTVDRFAYTVDAELTTQNINTLNVMGIYGQRVNVNATSARGYPVAAAGTLFVTNSAYGCQQMYIPFWSGDIWQRGLSGNWNGSGPWYDWRRINEWGNVHGKPSTFPPSTHNHNGVHVIQAGGNQNVHLRITSGQLQAYIGSSWRVVWPPQWQ